MAVAQQHARVGGTVRTQAAGRLTVAAGVLGAVSAAVIVAWPDQVTESRYSYPFDASGYTAAQLFFAVQHLVLVAGLAALLPLARGATRTTRAGVWTSIVGMVGLSACEVYAITAADAATTSAAADAVNASYGLPTTVLGLGLVLAGVGVARRNVLAGRDKWVVLVLGVWIFVVLLPALFGPLVVGRAAIGLWMLLFAWLGLALVRHGGRAEA